MYIVLQLHLDKVLHNFSSTQHIIFVYIKLFWFFDTHNLVKILNLQFQAEFNHPTDFILFFKTDFKSSSGVQIKFILSF
jgi:hypothetical protein